MYLTPEIAQQALLSYEDRLALCNKNYFVSKRVIDAQGILHEWKEAFSDLTAEEQNQILWEIARNKRKNSWEALYSLLSPHLSLIQEEMFVILNKMPGNDRYRQIFTEIIKAWRGSVTKTPTSVVWILALARAKGEISPDMYPLAAAAAFYYQGVVILDDIADGELPAVCAAWPRGQAEHIGFSMACALPLASMDCLKASDRTKIKLINNFYQAVYMTNSGQYLDLETLGPVVRTPKEAEEIAQIKAGFAIGRITNMASNYFDLSISEANHWENATSAFATARQIASDVGDLWRRDVSPDMATGKCTLPIAYVLETLNKDEYTEFQALRNECRYISSRQPELRHWLDRQGALEFVQKRIRYYYQQGLDHLEMLEIPEPALEWILTWAGQADVFGDVF